MSLDLQASALRHDAVLAALRGQLRAAETAPAVTASVGWSGRRALRGTADRRLRALGVGLRRLAGAGGTAMAGGA